MEKEIFVETVESEVRTNEEKLRKYLSLLSAANELARLTGPPTRRPCGFAYCAWTAHRPCRCFPMKAGS